MSAKSNIPAELAIVDAIKTLPVGDDFVLSLFVEHSEEYDRPGRLYCRELNAEIVNRHDNSVVGEITLKLFFPHRYYNPDVREMSWDVFSAVDVLFEVCDDLDADLGVMAQYIGDNLMDMPIQGPFAYLKTGEDLLLREFGKPALDSIFKWLYQNCDLGELYLFPGIPENLGQATEIEAIKHAWVEKYLARECEGGSDGLTYVPFWVEFDDDTESEDGMN